MRLQPIVYTADMEAAVRWYGAVLGIQASYRSEVWTSFAVGDATLGIHTVSEPVDTSRGDLSLIATEPLEEVLERLARSGIEPAEGIVRQPFGRSFLLRDPDGSPVQVNEHG